MKMLEPIAEELIDPTDAAFEHITFDAFFSNTMFHEVAHGLGIKETINGKGPVRRGNARRQSSRTRRGQGRRAGPLPGDGKLARAWASSGDADLMDNYVTFLAGIFRSVRFGASSAHGRANMVRFNYFAEAGAFTRNADDGTYRVNFEAMQQAMADLSRLILTIQGDGDYEGAARLLEEQGLVSAALQADLDRLNAAGIPVDVVFEQGTEVLGL